MHKAAEWRITLFADQPDPIRDLWVGFVEVMVTLADGQQAIDVHALDHDYPTRAAALAAAEAWVARYTATVGDIRPAIVVVRL